MAGLGDRLQNPQAAYDRNKPYVRPGASNFSTTLAPDYEMAFRQWLAQNSVPFDPDSQAPQDYDMRGFWQGLQNQNPVARSAIDPNDKRMHYPDYWKTPYHETFSNESQWATDMAPRWNAQDQLTAPSGRILFDDRVPADKRIAGAFEASQGMQEPSRALYEAKHRRAQGLPAQTVEPGFWSDLMSAGPAIRGTLKAMTDPRTSPFSPAEAVRLLFDPAGEAGRQVEAGKRLVEPVTQFNDPNVDPVKQGADLGLTAMGMSSVVPEEANSLRMGIKAYHGSPHDFAPEPGAPLGRFRSDKIGTGEGNQAFGYGHYTAEREGVAQEYRDKLTHRNFINEPQDPRKVGEALFDVEARDGGLIDGKIPFGPTRGLKTREQIANMFASGEASAFDLRPAMQKKINEFMKPPGHMYEVDIAADPEHFLDWDKPLSEQSEGVRKALEKLGFANNDAVGERLKAISLEMDAMATDRDPVTNMMRDERRWHDLARERERLFPLWDAHQSGSKIYNAVVDQADKVRRGSMPYNQRTIAGAEQLREAGIPGIRYLDQGSRTKGTVVAGDGKPTGYHNIDSMIANTYHSWDNFKAANPNPNPQLKAAIDELDARGGVKFNREAGTSNFVVFDDKLISILKKYGLPISAAGLAALSQLHPQEAQAQPLGDRLQRGSQ